MKIRAPKNVAQATELLERVAELDGLIGTLEGRRSRMMARTNAAIDARTMPLLQERAAIAERIEPWWATAKAELLAKDRKSIELGGCMIGSRMGGKSLVHGFPNEDEAVGALRVAKLAKTTTRTTTSLDKAGIRKLIEAGGKIAASLLGLGFSVGQSETFFLERAQQRGTVGA